MKKNNKGFSLVELIVVIAIMAVLVGVLAPALLRYVEKSRYQKDVSAIGEVVNAIEVACADETIANYVKGQSTAPSFSFAAGTKTEINGTDVLSKELILTIKEVTLSSATITNPVVITVSIDNNGIPSITVTGGVADSATYPELGKLSK